MLLPPGRGSGVRVAAYVVVLLVGIAAGALAFPGSETTRTREDIRNACLYAVIEALGEGDEMVSTNSFCEALSEGEREALLATQASYIKRMFGVS